MGGSKKKLKMKKKMEKEKGSTSVGYEELRDDLFREAAKLVAEDPSSKIAILVTPPSGSEDSVHCFGHPSAEGVVQTFLNDNRHCPVPEDAENEEDEEEEDPSPQQFWWENEKEIESMNQEQLEDACKNLSDMIRQLKAIEKGQGSGNKKAPKP